MIGYHLIKQSQTQQQNKSFKQSKLNLNHMNIKKKIQRNSFKKLLSNTRRPDFKLNDFYQTQHQHKPFGPASVSKSSKHKSAQKILSVYESSKAKFKIGKFLNQPQRQQRIKTENDEFNKTKSTYHKLNSVRKIYQKEKEQKPFVRNVNVSGRVGTNTRPLAEERNKGFIEMTKNRAFNKRMNLNAELFENTNSRSIEKCEAPQTSKHQKINHLSFRKQHDSYRAINKKTALEKYISESLENLENPTKKKTSKSTTKQANDDLILHQDEKQKSFSKCKNNNLRPLEGTSRSIQKVDFSGIPYEKRFLDKYSNGVNEVKTIRSPQQQQKSHRKLKTNANDSIQKIEIKWEKKKKNPFDLSNEEMEIFGDRFPDGYDKIKLLGRGGFSLVWLGEHKKSKKKYAIKQIITESNHETHKKQIWFGEYFFDFGGVTRSKFLHNSGIKNLVKLYYYFVNKKDTWLLYEKCGDSLGNALYELKGENYNGEKIYRIHYKDFYRQVKSNQNEIRKIIFQVSRALQLLTENNIIHSDLKTENILVKIRSEEDEGKTLNAKGSGRRFKNSIIQEVKLIDYGSSFQFSNLRQFSMATPEYMAPEILNFILYENELQYIPKLFQYVQEYHNPWVIDIWSLGCVILEIVSGIPLWMSLKTVVNRKGKQLIRYGLFAVKGRTFDKIIKKQLQIVQNLERFLRQQNYSQIEVDEDIKYLLKKMLCLNPAKRISPSQIIEFLSKKSLQNN